MGGAPNGKFYYFPWDIIPMGYYPRGFSPISPWNPLEIVTFPLKTSHGILSHGIIVGESPWIPLESATFALKKSHGILTHGNLWWNHPWNPLGNATFPLRSSKWNFFGSSLGGVFREGEGFLGMCGGVWGGSVPPVDSLLSFLSFKFLRFKFSGFKFLSFKILGFKFFKFLCFWVFKFLRY